MFKLKQAGFKFGEREVFKDLNLSLKPKEFVAILGSSGCGKSTLLRVIGRLLSLTSGELTFCAAKPPVTSMVFQEPQLLPWRTVRSNIALSLQLRKQAWSSIDEVLSLVGLSGSGDRYPEQLSGGMKMRVSLARALVSKPELLLMDEPFSALDEITRKAMGDEVLGYRKWCKSSIVLVTHSVEEALYLADRVLVMPKQSGPWSCEHKVNTSGPRDLEWKRSAGFLSQVDKLSEAIAQGMESCRDDDESPL